MKQKKILDAIDTVCLNCVETTKDDSIENDEICEKCPVRQLAISQLDKEKNIKKIMDKKECGYKTMTNQDAKQIIQNFPNWNMDDQWLDNAEMEELIKVLNNALEKC